MESSDTTMTTSPHLVENLAAVLTAPRQMRIETRPIPEPQAGDVLIRVEAVGICGSDAHYYHEGRIGEYMVEAPLILGHETSGTVVALGPGVTSVAVGDLVALEPGVACGRCEWCTRGHYNLCPEVRFHATPPVDGTLQKYVTMPERYVFPLPAGLDPAHGALIEPLAVAVWACQKASVSAASRVLVTGAGTIGILTAQVARAFGAQEVVITDLDRSKLDVAAALGADRALDASELASAPHFDVHVECSGNERAASMGLATLRQRGISVIVGMGSDTLTIPTQLLQGRELFITGVFRYANCFPLAIELLRSGRVQVEPLITGRFTLSEAEEALSSSGGPGVFKNVVRPSA